MDDRRQSDADDEWCRRCEFEVNPSKDMVGAVSTRVAHGLT